MLAMTHTNHLEAVYKACINASTIFFINVFKSKFSTDGLSQEYM